MITQLQSNMKNQSHLGLNSNWTGLRPVRDIAELGDAPPRENKIYVFPNY